MAPHEMRPHSTLDTPEESRYPCRPWRRTLRFQPQIQMRILALGVTAEEFRGAPRDSRGDCTSLRPHKQVPEVPFVTGEEPLFRPQIEMRTSAPETTAEET